MLLSATCVRNVTLLLMQLGATLTTRVDATLNVEKREICPLVFPWQISPIKGRPNLQVRPFWYEPFAGIAP